MYNRYIRNENGSYTRVPHAEPEHHASSTPQTPPEEKRKEKRQNTSSIPGSQFLKRMLEKLHMENVDTGDIILLLLLFLLFEEKADDELLIALGLLLIL